MKMDTNVKIPAHRIRWTGILSVLAGSMYIPWFPWYLLGRIRESEIFLWGILSFCGGILAFLGTFLFRHRNRIIVQMALIAGFLGMLLSFAAQAPPLISWIQFGGEGIGMAPFLPMILHAAIAFLSLYSMASIGWLLAHSQSFFRLSLKQGFTVVIIFALAGSGWYGWESYRNANWVEVTSPMNGAKNVSLYASVIVQWKKPMEVSNMGMSIEYADDPSVPILGATSGSKDGMTFIPDAFLPGKKVEVTVSAGRRSHSFFFTTAEEADERIDLYRAVMKFFFRAPQEGMPPGIVALDTSSLKGWPNEEKKSLAKGLLAYTGGVAFGSPEEGFQPVDDQFPVSLEENQEALLLTIQKEKEQFGEFEMLMTVKRGSNVLKGLEESTFSVRYKAAFQNGKWEVEPLGEESQQRPWG